MRRNWRLAIGVLVAFWLIGDVRFAFYRVPWFVAFAHAHPASGVTTWKFAQVVLCFAAVMLLYRVRPSAAVAELGLAHLAGRSLAIALGLMAPAILLLAATTRSIAERDPEVLVRTAVASPLAEEILFRGLLFRQLHRRAHWPFWLAAVTSAVPFAAGHLYQANGRGFGGFVEVMLVMSVVSAVAAWVFTRWDDDTWLLIGIHAFANLAWALFVGDDTARMYGWLQYAFLVALLLPTLVATGLRSRVPWLARPSHAPPY